MAADRQLSELENVASHKPQDFALVHGDILWTLILYNKGTL